MIYRAYNIKDKVEVFLKKISIGTMKFIFGDNFLKMLNREISLLQSLKCYKNSVYYYGKYDSNNEIVLIFEKCDENLKEFMERGNKTFTSEEIKSKLKELNKIFYYFYEKSIIHKNLKLENILMKYTNKKKK
jgi:serine/threonine protein kinase